MISRDQSGNSSGVPFSSPLFKGEGVKKLKFIPLTLPSPPRRCEKIDLVPFYVIPAKAGIQCFQSLSN